MNYYIVTSANELYDILNNGIEVSAANIADDNTISVIFSKLEAKGGIPIVFKINNSDEIVKNASTNNIIDPEYLEMIDSKEIGISNVLSSMIFNIVASNDSIVLDSIKKVAKEFAINGNEDLADYLSLAVKIATGGKEKRSKISYEYVMNKLNKENALVFEREYKTASDIAKQNKIKNYKEIALAHTINKLGVSIV